MAVDWGLAHRDLSNIEAIGVDELSRRPGNATSRWSIRSTATPSACSGSAANGGPRRCTASSTGSAPLAVRPCASTAGMWALPRDRERPAKRSRDRPLPHRQPPLPSDRRRRAADPQARRRRQAPVLKHSSWLLLKRPELHRRAATGLPTSYVATCGRSAPISSRSTPTAVLRVAYWAGRFLDRWCTRTMRSRLDPMKDVARMVRSHRDLILNWFRAKGQFSSGIVEGFNGKARVITKRAGFRTCEAMQVALYHTRKPARTRAYPQILARVGQPAPRRHPGRAGKLAGDGRLSGGPVVAAAATLLRRAFPRARFLVRLAAGFATPEVKNSATRFSQEAHMLNRIRHVCGWWFIPGYLPAARLRGLDAEERRAGAARRARHDAGAGAQCAQRPDRARLRRDSSTMRWPS